MAMTTIALNIKPQRIRKIGCFLTLCGIALSQAAIGQENTTDLYDIGGEFAFARVQYDSYYNGGRYGGPWATDFPAADENFLRGVARLTNVRVMSQPIVLRFDSDEIFDKHVLFQHFSEFHETTYPLDLSLIHI